MRKNQLEAIALTGMIEGKRAGGRQRKPFMDSLLFACGEQWKINDILKICQDRNDLSRHLHWIAEIINGRLGPHCALLVCIVWYSRI